MRSVVLFFVVSLFAMKISAQDIFMSANTSISFFSETAIENIDAYTTTAVGAVNVKTKDIFFTMANQSFKFKKALMQEHFNENYMESEKYPKSTFKGKINEDVDLTRDGTYPVTATGDLDIHGVTQPRTINGTITVKDGKLDVSSEFDVKISDHKITVPSVVSEHLAETVHVKMHAVMDPSANK